MAKVVIHKATAEGEQLVIEVPSIPQEVLKLYAKDPHVLSTYLAPYFRLADDRLWEMNKRIAAMNARLRNASPETQIIVHEIHALLYGQVPPQDIDAMIAKDREERNKEMAKPEVAQQVKGVVERLIEAGVAPQTKSEVLEALEDDDEGEDE